MDLGKSTATADRLSVFVPISKINEATQEVFGFIAEEQPDRSGEILDYLNSKPLFQEWSESQKVASGGKSLGNVREMHGKNAVGKLTQIDFNDAEKRVFVGAKIVDDAAWRKVSEGVHTGFSIGGEYVGNREPIEHATYGKLLRYIARPQEVSLVDRPCMPGATFTAVKADGTEEQRPLIGRKTEQVWTCPVPEHRHAAKAEALACEGDDVEKAERTDESSVSSKEGESKYGDVKFADSENKKYPIDTEAHIRAAWNYINKEKNAAKYKDGGKSVKAKIVAAWKAKIDKDGPPSAEKMAPFGLQKCLWCVTDMAAALAALDCLQERLECEAEYERDSSPLPDALQAEIEHLGELLVQLVEEETGEMAEPEPMEQWTHGRVKTLLAKLSPDRRNQARESLNKAAEALERAAMTEDEMEKAELQKMLSEQRDSLQKVVTDALAPVMESIKKVDERLIKVEEKTPAGKPPVLRPVDKAADTTSAPTTKDEEPKDDIGLIKDAFSKPIPMDPRVNGGQWGPIVRGQGNLR